MSIVALAETPILQFLNNAGQPNAGGSILTQVGGVNYPTFQDAAGSTPLPNPIPLNSRGEVSNSFGTSTQMFLFPGVAYTFTLFDVNGNQLWTANNVQAIAPVAVGSMTDEKGSGGQVGFAAGVDFTAGTTTTLTLSSNYGSASNLWVAFDGAEQGGDSFSLSGTTLTFNAPIPFGTNKVYVKGGTSLTIGTPGASTVTDANVAANAAIQASKLSFLQAGAGAVARSVQSKERDIVSVLDFGAKGDGVNDDTASIQAAITYVLSLPNGGAVYMPTGTYKVTAQINIPNAAGVSIRIYGDGAGTRLKYTGTATTNIFFAGSGTATFGSFYIFENFGFLTPSGGVVTAIYLKNINSSLLYNVDVLGNQNALILESSFNTRVIGCDFNSQTQYGISTNITGTNSLLVNNCVISNAATAAINLAIGGNNIVIRDNDLEGNAIAVGMNGYTSVLIEGNYIELGTSVVFFFSGSNAQVDIIQNWLGANAISTPFDNIVGGSFNRNTLFNSAWTTTSTAVDFVIGYNWNFGGATLPVTTWQTPALLNTFGQQSPSYYTAQFIKDKDGFITLRGNLVNGAAGQVIFNLQAGYRPASNMTFSTSSTAGTGGSSVEVRSNGDVVCITRDSGGGTGLNGIRFSAEQ